MSSIDLDESAELLKALAHSTRLAILRSLVDGERSVGDLEQVSGIGQPALSQQLAVLRNAQLVETRRKSKLVFYRINHARLGDISALLNSFARIEDVPRDQAADAARLRGRNAAMFARVG